MDTSGLLGRLKAFFEGVGPAVIVPAGLLLIVLLFLTVMGKRMALLALFMLCLMFSGFVVEAVSTGSTLLRWLIMFLITATCIYGVKSPGLPALMLSGYAVIGIITMPMAPSLSWAIQNAGLMFIITVPMAAAIAHCTESFDDIMKLLKLYLLAGGVYALLGISTLPSLVAGQRFAGATTNAPLFALTGGLLLPISLWGAMSRTGKGWRLYCIFLTTAIALILVISGQRTGTFAGFIGCLPLLARFGIRKLFLGIILTGLGIVAVIYVFSLMPEQAQFVKRRFTNLETTGRAEIWLDALSMCLKRPFLGYGSGGSQILGSFHNAYLTAWYEGGLAGLILFGGAFVVMALRELKLVVQQKHEEILDLARLLLGLTLASIAAGFFESKLVSPSNIAIFTAIIVSVILTRLKSLLREYWFEPVPEEELPDDASYANDGYDSYS